MELVAAPPLDNVIYSFNFDSGNSQIQRLRDLREEVAPRAGPTGRSDTNPSRQKGPGRVQRVPVKAAAPADPKGRKFDASPCCKKPANIIFL